MMYRHEDYVKAIEMVEDGKIFLRPLMSRVFPFDQFRTSFSCTADCLINRNIVTCTIINDICFISPERLQHGSAKLFPFDQFKQAYEYIDADRETAMKILIDVQS